MASAFVTTASILQSKTSMLDLFGEGCLKSVGWIGGIHCREFVPTKICLADNTLLSPSD